MWILISRDHFKDAEQSRNKCCEPKLKWEQRAGMRMQRPLRQTAESGVGDLKGAWARSNRVYQGKIRCGALLGPGLVGEWRGQPKKRYQGT